MWLKDRETNLFVSLSLTLCPISGHAGRLLLSATVPSSSPFLADRFFRNENGKQEEIWVVVLGEARGWRCLNAS